LCHFESGSRDDNALFDEVPFNDKDGASELAVGVMTALLGGPVFIALVVWKVK
jgi:ABC-type cobalamin transport system permease subunit